MLQTPSVQGGEAPFLDRPVIRQRIEIREGGVAVGNRPQGFQFPVDT